MNLRAQVKGLADDVYTEVHHGEAFYDKREQEALQLKLDKLKKVSAAYYEENQKELAEDEL